MTSTIYSFYHSISSPHFLLVVISISLIVKGYFLSILARHGLKTSLVQKPLIFLFGTIIGSFFGDWAWVVKLLRQFFNPDSSYKPITFCIRIAWIFVIIQYQSLSLFIQSLIEKNFKLSRLHIIFYALGLVFSSYFAYRAFFAYEIFSTEEEREAAKMLIGPPFEITAMRYVIIYLLTLLIVPGLYFTSKKKLLTKLPKILYQQLRICTIYLLCPYFLAEFIQAGFFNFKIMQLNLYPIVSISTLLLTYAIYYCMQQVMGLRFLNFEHHVQSPPNLNLINDFKTVLEQLSNVKSLNELQLIAQSFFQQGFNIPLKSTTVFIRSSEQMYTNELSQKKSEKEELVEKFITQANKETIQYIFKNQLLIYDEIAFTEFYENSDLGKKILSFLDELHADIFIPLYFHQTICGYIIITRNARPNECYSEAERNAMLIFANYLVSIINLLQNKNTQTLVQQQKELKEELFSKHQEVNQYRESIKYFLRHTKQKDIGIIFYKNRRFIFGNQAAQQLITFDVNVQQGHPLSKALKNVAQQVLMYKTPFTQLAKNASNNLIAIAGVPHLEHSSVIITIASPDISDLITKQIDFLQNPAQWDYLLYLETTHAGHMINQLIPGIGEQLINLKIQLLQYALSKKTIVLDMPDEDLTATAELLHHISLRETLHVLEFTHKEKNNEIGATLFGINPIMNTDTNLQNKPLLKKLDGIGTLFIKNIHFLDSITQRHLTEFLRLGTFRHLHAEQKYSADVRIIFSSNQNLYHLVQNDQFDKDLFLELKQNRLVSPSLLTLASNEFYSLIDGFAEQAIQHNTFANLLALTEKDKARFSSKRPSSLQELKNKVHQFLLQKSKQSELNDEITIDPAFSVTDPELLEAARLGKQALKDPKIMSTLWNKFKNQNKIATFLGVNRSSVNRRCKEYNFS